MGTLIGHVVAGTYLIFFGVWWTFNQFRRYHQSRGMKGPPYHNSVTFKFFFLPGRLATWEMEGLLKLLVSSGVFIGEMTFPGHPTYYLDAFNGQHFTMHSVFFVDGLMDILLHHKAPFPKSIPYISLSLAFSIMGFLFVFHVYGKTGIDAAGHILVAYCCLATALATLLEMNYPDSVLAGLTRSYCSSLQGTWLCQLFFILQNPFPGDHVWDPENEHHVALLYLMFTWYMSGVFIGQMVIGAVIACIYYRRKNVEGEEYQPLQGSGKDQETAITTSIVSDDVHSESE